MVLHNHSQSEDSKHTYLFKEFLLHGDVVVADAEDDEAVLGLLARVTALAAISHYQVVGPADVVLRDQLVLNQDQRLHRVLESEFVLAHLRENRTDVQMDIARIRHLEAVVHRLLTEVQVIVFDFQRFLQEAQRRPQLLRSSENAREVVISHGAVTVSLIRVGFGLLQQF